MKKHKIILVLMGLALLLWGCSSSTLVEVVEGPDTLAEGGHYKLGGAGIKPNFLRSFDFSEGELIAEDLFDEELLQYVPVLPANEWLPFEFPKRLAYSTSYSKPGDDKLYNQLQLTYLPEKNATGDFFVIRISEAPQNPMESKLPPLGVSKDDFGNLVEAYPGEAASPIVHHRITTASSYTYHYYGTDEENDQVHLITTTANEVSWYENGLYYELAYPPTSSGAKQTDRDAQVLGLAMRMSSASAGIDKQHN